jgi:hypothetical protein
MIGVFICYLLDPTSSWAFCLPDVWSLVGSWFGEIEASSLATKHIINPGELRFPIGLPTDWQSPIGLLCSNQAEWLHLWHNSRFIFLFGILFHRCYRVIDVFKIKKSPYGFNFYLIHTSISSVDSWAFFKKILHILFWLVMTSILLYRVIIWTCAELNGCIFYKHKTSELFWCDTKSIWHVLLVLVNP